MGLRGCCGGHILSAVGCPDGAELHSESFQTDTEESRPPGYSFS